MIHQSASSQPRPAGPGIPRIRRWATGLVVAAIASLGGAPAALAVPLPPPGGATGDPVIPSPPPPAPAAAHLPLWAVLTIVAATIVLSVGTTLVTLSLEHRRRARGTTAAAAGPSAGARTPSTAAEPPAGPGDILSSHQHPADHDMHRAESR
jgi:hypothetical protein